MLTLPESFWIEVKTQVWLRNTGTLAFPEKKLPIAFIVKLFLDKLARQLEISSEEYEEILENPLKYPINPPYLYTQRLERLYDLSRMVYTDHVLGQKQKNILQKFAVALGFTPSNVTYIVDKALSLMVQAVDLDTFTYEMQHMNK